MQRRNHRFAQLRPSCRSRSAALEAKIGLERFRLPRGRRRQKHVGKGRGGIGEHVYVHIEIERSECLLSARRVAMAYQRVVTEQHYGFDRVWPPGQDRVIYQGRLNDPGITWRAERMIRQTQPQFSLVLCNQLWPDHRTARHHRRQNVAAAFIKLPGQGIE